MKTILILTDFTKNAAHAALSAVTFSEKLHANLLLFNVNTSAPVVPQYAGGPTVIDDFGIWEKESREKLSYLTDSIEPLIADVPGNHRKPTVHIECGEGNVGVMANRLTEQKDIELVVMGAKAGSAMDHILMGSDTVSVIDHVRRPVLVVPLNAGVDKLDTVVFATDYHEGDMAGVHYLVKLGKLFNFRLIIAHVNLFHEKNMLEMEQENSFIAQIKRLRYPNIEFKVITGKDVTNRLNNLCDETGANMLAVMHYKNSFTKRIFTHSTTHKALDRQKIPLMVFPAKMAD